jgi:NADPH-dependent 2,4-dienoyl-CoA reductase/sulfur reductase-like enzyme/rhodanese-related sulfurtransferase
VRVRAAAVAVPLKILADENRPTIPSALAAPPSKESEMRVLIVGAGAGGLAAAARLRRLDESAEIVVFEKSPHASLATCGLPYLVGGVVDRDDLILQTAVSLRSRHDFDVRVLKLVVDVDRAARTIRVRDLRTGRAREEPYDKLILAPGAVPFKPPIPGLDSEGVLTLRTLNDAMAIKEAVRCGAKRVVVLGGGAIGMEMAENLYAVGLEVVIVEAAEQIIAPLDFDMAAIVGGHLKRIGVEVLTGAAVRSIKRHSGRLEISVGPDKLVADLLILAAGIRAEIRLAVECSLDVDDRGHIVVDGRMMTSDPDIYAVGDAVRIKDPVNGIPASVALAGPARKQGRVAADAIAGLASAYGGALGTVVIKAFDLRIAFTGLGEMSCRRQGYTFERSFTVSPHHVVWYPGIKWMIVKTIFNPLSGLILGVQFVGGDGVDKRCDVMATAIRLGATASDLAGLDLSFAPLFGAPNDPINVAGQVAENIVAGRSRVFHWSEVDGLDPDQATLLDVRTAKEFKEDPLPGFVNIPIDELRRRLGGLDRRKPVMVACWSGVRGHLAERLLTQYGFDARNLSGGQLVYSFVKASKATLGREVWKPAVRKK